MARKAWDQLTPEYRARLERGGITAEKHSQPTTPIGKAVGHGWDTPHMAQRYQRAVNKQLVRAVKNKRIPPDVARETIDRLGPDRVKILLDWQTQRMALGRGADKGGQLTLELFIRSEYGPDAWDAEWEDIQEELHPSFRYY